MHEAKVTIPREPARLVKAPQPRHFGFRRYSVALFLIALVLLLLAMPFVDQLRNGKVIEAVLATLVLLSAVSAVGGRRHTLIAAALLMVPALTGRWLDRFHSGPTPRAFATLAEIVFLTFVMVCLLRFILRAPRVNSEVMCAGVAGFLMLGIVWAMIFLLMARLQPSSLAIIGGDPAEPLDTFEALYLSFGSLTTLGFGNVNPMSRPAQMAAVFEALSGMFYMAILISRLVSLYSGGSSRGAEGRSD